MSRTMKITLSPSIKGQGEGDQTVGFFEMFEGAVVASSSPQETGYDLENISLDTFDIIALLDYYNFNSTISDNRSIYVYEGYAPIKRADNLSVTIFRQEVEETEEELDGKTQTVITGISQLEQIADEISDFHFKDYKVANGRTYQYFIYPSNQLEPLSQISGTVKTHWGGWSITELHPVSVGSNKYTASPSDVWVFNLNVETGEQNQNLGREQQETLGQFARFSQGKKNYISGQVSCYLGRDFLPMSFVLKKTANGSYYKEEGGYQEKPNNSIKLSSNDRVDMLKEWRKLVYSNNPKLLKDRKGQIFLVTLSNASNTPQDNIKHQPDLINFSWTQIGNVDKITIIGTDD